MDRTIVSCEERKDQILVYAASDLSEAEAESLRDHLDRGCPRCAGSLAEAEAVIALLAQSLPPVDPPPAVRTRVLERIEAGSREPRAARGRPRRFRALLAGGAAAAAAAGLAAALTARFATPPLDADSEDVIAMLDEQDLEIGALERTLQQARESIATLRSPRVEAYDLEPMFARAEAAARIFWDWEKYTCYFHVTGLTPAKPGHTYAVWLYTADDEIVLAGTFATNSLAEGSFYAVLPEAMGQVTRTVVTEEATPPGDEPAGPVLLAGETPS